MFKDKNLIVITAEAFSPIAIDKELTPTLYKMYTEGFSFSNFYTPIFYVSTSDGEYVSLTSLLPKEGVWSFQESSKISLPFVYGNILKDYGYSANAYHNGRYNYYKRNGLYYEYFDYDTIYNALMNSVWSDESYIVMKFGSEDAYNSAKYELFQNNMLNDAGQYLMQVYGTSTWNYRYHTDEEFCLITIYWKS